MARITIAPGLGIPPAGIVERFSTTMRAVAGTWRDVAASGIPVQITSWWRSTDRNAAAGGRATSQHLLGCAMDAVSPVGQAALLAAAQRAARGRGTSALISERGAVHVQGLPYGTVAAIFRREPQIIRAVSSFVGPPRPVLPVSGGYQGYDR